MTCTLVRGWKGSRQSSQPARPVHRLVRARHQSGSHSRALTPSEENSTPDEPASQPERTGRQPSSMVPSSPNGVRTAWQQQGQQKAWQQQSWLPWKLWATSAGVWAERCMAPVCHRAVVRSSAVLPAVCTYPIPHSRFPLSVPQFESVRSLKVVQIACLSREKLGGCVSRQHRAARSSSLNTANTANVCS